MKRLPWLSLMLLLVCYAGFGWYLAGLDTQPDWLKSSCIRIFGPIADNSPAFQALPVLSASVLEVPESSSDVRKSPEPSPLVVPSASPSAAATQPEATPANPANAEPGANPPAEKTAVPSEKSQSQQDRQTICGIVVRHNIHIAFLAIAWILLSSLAFISPLTSFSSFITRWFKSDTMAFMTIVTIAGMAAVILYWLHVFLQILTILAADALARVDLQTAGKSGNQAFWMMTLVSLTGLITGWLANVIMT